MLKSSRVKKILPAVALAGAVVTLLCLVVLSAWRVPAITDTGETRPVVEQALARIQALHPVSLDAPAFRKALEQLSGTPYVATVWLISPGPDGCIIYSHGATSCSTPLQRTAAELATDDTRSVLSALPPGMLDAQQRTWVLAASAIRREGEHNDIYRHLLCSVADSKGRELALVGVAFDASTADIAGPAWKTVCLAGLAGLAAYWFSLPLWVLLDARERGERGLLWAIFVLVGNLVALVAYLLTRSARPQVASPR